MDLEQESPSEIIRIKNHIIKQIDKHDIFHEEFVE